MPTTSIQTLIDFLRANDCSIKPSGDGFFVRCGDSGFTTSATDLAIAFTCIATNKDFHLHVDGSGMPC